MNRALHYTQQYADELAVQSGGGGEYMRLIKPEGITHEEDLQTAL